MRIGGLQKLTLLDYPGKVACTVFLSGCNLRCPYCHNPGLVLPEQSEGSEIPEAEVLSFLERRKGKLDGVCITGGEPTLQKDLPELTEKIRALGYQVKLDTNGTNPSMVKQLYQDHLIDYVAMDLKASRQNYPVVSGCPAISLEKLQETMEFLMNSGIDYEFRTTVVKGLHTKHDFEDIACWIPGAKRYFLQSYQDSGHILIQEQQRLSAEQASAPRMQQALSAFTAEEMKEFLQLVQPSIPSARLRGIEDSN